MAKNYLQQGTDLDNLFEAAFSNFITTTLTGYTPQIKYCDGDFTCFFESQGDTAYYALKGTLPSNTLIVNYTTTGTWYKISRASGGFSVGSNTYYNSSRGSYPYNRIGLVFCGGGGGGSGYRAEVSYPSASIEEADVDAYSGYAGGGASTIACILYLDQYDYYINIGAGGSGANSSDLNSATGGGTTSLRVNSSSGTVLAYAYGGGAGKYSSTGAGGSYYTTSNSYYRLLGAYAGGNGGNRGNYQLIWSSEGGDVHIETLDYNTPNYCKGSNSGSGNIYLSQTVSASLLSLSGTTTTGVINDNYSHQVGYPTGGGCAARSTYKYGYGGNASMFVDNSAEGEFSGPGSNGQGGCALFYY